MTVDSLLDGDMENLRHMLGATQHRPKKDWGFRNHYACGDAASAQSLERLVSAGFCVRGRPYMKAHFYHATRAGCVAAGLSEAATNRALSD
jgi:hypothetical protein